MLDTGGPAPAFSLEDQDGKKVSLADQLRPKIASLPPERLARYDAFFNE